MKEKIGFVGSLKNMFVGVVKPEAYMKNGQHGKTWPAVIIVFAISILLYLFTFWLPYNKLFGGGRLARMVDDAVEDFTLTNDGFYYADRYQWSDGEDLTYILIDTSLKDSSAEEIESLRKEGVYRSIYVVTSSEIVTIENGRVNSLSTKDMYNYLNDIYHARSFGKQDILNIINKWDTPVLVALYIGNVLAGVIKIFFMSLMLAIVGLIIASALKVKVSLGSVYKMAIYIRTIWYSIMLLIATYVWPAKRTAMSMALLVCAAYMFMAIYRYKSQYPDEFREQMPV